MEFSQDHLYVHVLMIIETIFLRDLRKVVLNSKQQWQKPLNPLRSGIFQTANDPGKEL